MKVNAANPHGKCKIKKEIDSLIWNRYIKQGETLLFKRYRYDYIKNLPYVYTE